MVDFLSPEERSDRMRRIRGKDTVPEQVFRRRLHAMGFRYRLNVSTLPGRPDIVLPRWHTVIFVHGCFWHRHERCPVCTTPKSRTGFWKSKFKANVMRDRRNAARLRRMGWSVLTVWECQTTSQARLARAVRRITKAIVSA